MAEMEPSATVLSAATIAGIVAQDMPGFVVAPTIDESKPAGAAEARIADAVALDVNAKGQLTGPETIAVRVVPEHPTDAPTPFPHGRTVLINTRSKHIVGAQG
jgi:hypothetical protein